MGTPRLLESLRRSAVRGILLAWMAGSCPCEAEDRSRGDGADPGRNLFVPETGLPDRFDPGRFDARTGEFDLRTARNVKWVARLGSQSHGQPALAPGKVLIGTNNDFPRDPRHQGDRSILKCLDQETGEFLWQLVVPKLASGKVNDWEGLGILSTAAIEGNRLYLATSRCEVVCLSTDGLKAGNAGPFTDEAQYVVGPGKPPSAVGPRDADILWRYDMIAELGVFPHHATYSNVLILGDHLYVATGNGMDWTHVNIPNPAAPSLVVLDKVTGKRVAEDREEISRRIYHSQWSSPSTGNVGGRQLVFMGGGDGFCYGFEAIRKPLEPGEGLKTAWRVDCNPVEYRHKLSGEIASPIKYPSAEGPSEIIATPVFWKDRVYVATGQDPEHGGGVGNLVCLEARTGGILWRGKSVRRTLSRPAITPEGLLFITDLSGFLHCFDALTGKPHWDHDLKANVWSSPLVADGKVYIGNEDGDFRIFAAEARKRLLSEIHLHAPIYVTANAGHGTVFVASSTHLFAIAAPNVRASTTREPGHCNGSSCRTGALPGVPTIGRGIPPGNCRPKTADEAWQQLDALPSESARILPRHGLASARRQVDAAGESIRSALPANP